MSVPSRLLSDAVSAWNNSGRGRRRYYPALTEAQCNDVQAGAHALATAAARLVLLTTLPESSAWHAATAWLDACASAESTYPIVK